MFKKYPILMRNLVWLAIFMSLAAVFVLTSCGSPNNAKASTTAPVSLAGEWHQTRNGIVGTSMTAEITSNSIQINMDVGEPSGIYWLGTFDTSEKTSRSFKVTSYGDQDAMATAIFAATEPTKVFSYEDGVITYQFSMMGMTTTVYLEK